MAKPLLQIALDTYTIEDAITTVDKIKDHIDIIEVGTVLLFSKGIEAVKVISERYPEKTIVADAKIAHAGKVFGKMFYENGADYTTCICAAEIPTILGTREAAKASGKTKDVQIELTENFTWEQAQSWLDAGVKQAVYHRSREAELAGVKWLENDVTKIKKLIEMGFKVTVTGGVSVADVEFFKDLPIYIFIVGRSILEAQNPAKAAEAFKKAIDKTY